MNSIDVVVALILVALSIALPIAIVKSIMSTFKGDNTGGSVNAGIAAAMVEIDRLTRPSIEHVEKIEDEILEDDEIDGE